MPAMSSYIITCATPNGELKERHVEAKNHLAAVKVVKAEGFTVLSIDRDDEESKSRSRKRWKGLFATIVICLILAVLCVALVWLRSGRYI